MMQPYSLTLVFPSWLLIVVIIALVIDCVLTGMSVALRWVMLRRRLEK